MNDTAHVTFPRLYYSRTCMNRGGGGKYGLPKPAKFSNSLECCDIRDLAARLPNLKHAIESAKKSWVVKERSHSVIADQLPFPVGRLTGTYTCKVGFMRLSLPTLSHTCMLMYLDCAITNNYAHAYI